MFLSVYTVVKLLDEIYSLFVKLKQILYSNVQFLQIKFMPCHIPHLHDKMSRNKCPMCKGIMVWYGYDGLVCIKCGFVGQEPVFSGRLFIV